jgi:hydroxymethylbilane synthase
VMAAAGRTPAARIRVGTRGSALALVQAELVRDALAAAGHETTIVVIETAGDRRAPDTAWGEGAFVVAIERAVLDGIVDLAVHSAKDLPTDEDPRLWIAAYLPRADTRDALVLPAAARERSLAELPAGARVGTDSPRRTQFLRAHRPDLRFEPLHGNVDTRLRRLDAGEADALILACAGLDRLGRSDRIVERIAPEIVPPAPGQGAIAMQVRADDRGLLRICGEVDDRPTRTAVEAERAFLRATGGGCRAPIGALATLRGDAIDLLGGHVADGGAPVFGRRTGPTNHPAELGHRLAEALGLADAASAGTWPDGHRPRVIVTRGSTGNAETVAALVDAGVDPLPVPAIRIDLDSGREAADRAAGLLHTASWAVVTSPNGGRAILAAAERVLADLGVPRWATVGAVTAAVLERDGIEVTFIPSRATAGALAEELPIAAGDVVLVLQGDLADRSPSETLRRRGAAVEDITVYRTVEAPDTSRGLLREIIEAGPAEGVLFTSGSTVRGLVALARDDAVDIQNVPAVCLGEPTAAAARAAGFAVLAVSIDPDPTAVALTVVRALRDHRTTPTPQLQEIR